MTSWVEYAACLADDEELSSWVAAHPELCRRESVETLLAEVLQAIHTDRNRALRLADAALCVGRACGDTYAIALALRASGAARYANSDFAGAIEDYTSALDLFDRLTDEIEAGKTLNSALQPLAYLGRFEQATAWAARAKGIFERHNDPIRKARLATNVANLLYRQDRHPEAIELYEEALVAFRHADNASDAAAALSNIAVCRTSLGQFALALSAYEQARTHCEKHGLTLLIAAADYNIAWLHYLRGDYLAAMELYAQTRIQAKNAGDLYHLALCDMDEAEIYLELNLVAEGAVLAKRAAVAFERLGMDYERGKSLVTAAMAKAHCNETRAAKSLFRKARDLFTRQNNHVWTALIDLDEAILARREGKPVLAARRCRRAWEVLSGSPLPGKAALCEMFQARLMLDKGEPGAARTFTISALSRLETSGSRAHRFQAYALLAQMEEAKGHNQQALTLWENARREIERLRNRLWGENSRIAFLKDKLSTYEALAHLYLNKGNAASAFAAIEQGKSRSMVEMLALPQSLPADQQLDELMKDLNGDYLQLELTALSQSADSAENIARTRRRIAEREEEIAGRFTALRDHNNLRVTATAIEVPDILNAVPAGTVLIEYYDIRGILHCCLVGSGTVQIIPVTAGENVRQELRFLQLQFLRIRAGGEQALRFRTSSSHAAERHLGQLYDALLSPVANALNGYRHLVIVPHGLLHEIPFHALFDGKQFLIERFTVSYAPSASVFSQCMARKKKGGGVSTVVATPDEHTPLVAQEALAVARALPGARLLMGTDATVPNLEKFGPDSRFLHIATHGFFRRDNPLFSAIRLGDSRISLLDLYRIPLTAELVTLSGCSTGLNAVVGGDELIGLIRGLLFAGARSVLASLWDVNDRSTTYFMTSFYEALSGDSPGNILPEALRIAALAVRQKYSHPYYWAPFILVGAAEIC